MNKIGIYLLAGIMIFGAIAHLAAPQFYAPLTPPFIPLAFANIAAFVSELAIGIGLLYPPTRRWAGLGFAALMLAFLPLHGWDLFREEPAMGSLPVAIGRFAFQFVLIYFGWRIWRRA